MDTNILLMSCNEDMQWLSLDVYVTGLKFLNILGLILAKWGGLVAEWLAC